MALRISLNLTHYYQDYRQFSRILINDDIETIGNLEERIASVFAIDNNFHLMCNNLYLPSCENIQIIDDHDEIYVMPNFESGSKVKAKKKSKNKNKFEVLERTNESKILKYVNGDINNINGENKPKKQKTKQVDNKQKKRSKKNSDEKTDETFAKPKTKKSKKNEALDDLPNKTNESEKIFDNNKTNEETIMEVCNNSNKTEENIATKENPTNSEDPSEVFENFDVISRKRRRCITPLKEKRPAMTCSELFTQEKRLKNIETNNEMETSSPNLIVQSVEVVGKEKQKELNDKLKENAENRQSYSLTDTLDFPSPTKSVTSNTSRSSFKLLRKAGGVGEILKALTTESTDNYDSDTTFNSEANFITKRKRCRVRKRRNKNEEQTTDTESPVVPFKPPRTVAAPKSHIKFTNDDEKIDVTENGFEKTQRRSNPANVAKNTLVHSTPIKQVIKDVNGSLKISVNNNLLLKNIDPSKCADLTDVPLVNNVILFKKLRMDENYAPIVSNQILAQVKDVLSNGAQLKVKIIDGLNEFREPTGRFSCIVEETELDLQANDDIVIVERSSFIEPKIYKT